MTKIGAIKRAFIAIPLVLSAACGPKEEPATAVGASAPQKTIQAEIVTITHTPVPIRIEVTGQVAAVFQASLSSRIQGTIDRLLVREGARVSKGQVLVRLDSRDLQAELSRATAEVDNAMAHLDRMNQLYVRDAVSKQEMENATRAYKVAEATRKAVEAQLSYTVVSAPFDGVITEKLVEAGELASPGQSLLRMEDPTHLRLEATVAEGDLKSVSRGDKIPVIIDALEGRVLDGVVGQVLPAGDPYTHTFTVKVDLPPAPGVKTGMFGRFRLDKGMSTTILVPDTAVIERGELISVFAVDSDRIARLRWVKAGRRLGKQIELLSGVNVGESILRDAARGLDGASVTVVDTAASPAASTP